MTLQSGIYYLTLQCKSQTGFLVGGISSWFSFVNYAIEFSIVLPGFKLILANYWESTEPSTLSRMNTSNRPMISTIMARKRASVKKVTQEKRISCPAC
jgi:hypothetical protein